MTSRAIKKPLAIPAGISVTLIDHMLTAKSGNKTLTQAIPSGVEIQQDGNALRFVLKEGIPEASANAGTLKALLSNVFHGLSKGFEKKLTLIGVGYRVQIQGKKLVLNLGFSKPVEYTVPAEIDIEIPSQTEIVVKGADKQLVGQVAATIRSFRSPEPYKGKGVRYANEKITLKEGKKK